MSLERTRREVNPLFFCLNTPGDLCGLMAYYHIKKKASLTDDDIYFKGGVSWSDDYSQRQRWTSKASVEAVLVNTDGTNGGMNNASYVKE